jgi:hypothetical protein
MGGTIRVLADRTVSCGGGEGKRCGGGLPLRSGQNGGLRKFAHVRNYLKNIGT